MPQAASRAARCRSMAPKMKTAQLLDHLRAVLAPQPQSPGPASVRIERDLRLDFFRGLSLFFIFIDHIPNNILSYGTLRAVGFSDAAEVFIFISGYTAALVYGQLWQRRGPVFASVQIYHRVWQLYVAHIFIFVIYTAEVSYATMKLQTPAYSEQLRLNDFLREPHVAIIKMLLLQYQPEFLDILPLYIVLLAIFPFVVWLLSRRPLVAPALSLAIYLLTLYFGWEPKTYPDNDGWFFNPFAWQFLFVIGACAGYSQIASRPIFPRIPRLSRIAMAVVLIIVVIKLSWLLHSFTDLIPALFYDELWTLADDKSDLSFLRLLSFFALALTVVHFVKRDNKFLHHRLTRLVILCGQHSLQVFCLGILLSVLGRFIVTSISASIVTQLAMNVGGIVLMIALAELMSWYKGKSRAAPATPVPPGEYATPSR
jgi:hypothetical protein